MLASKTARWSALAALASVLLIVGVWFAIIGPKRSEAAEISDQVVSAEQQNQGLQVQVAQLKAQSANLGAAKAELAAIQKQMPADESMPEMITQLNQMANLSGVSLQSITPQPAQALAAGASSSTGAASNGTAGTASQSAAASATSNVLKVPVTVVVQGDYFQVTAFLKKLQEDLPRAYLVGTINIIPVNESGSSSTGGSGKVDLTINGDMFILKDSPATTGTGSSTTTNSTSNASALGGFSRAGVDSAKGSK